MKITINLTDAEVKGIKKYLQVCNDIQKPTKKDIQILMQSYAGIIHCPREQVSDYIDEFTGQLYYKLP